MLYWNTVNERLKDALLLLMKASIFDQFRLVGGTSLSLQLGHRMSIDIDLFTDSPYKSIDFDEVDEFLKDYFKYVDVSLGFLVANGKSYAVGQDKLDMVKLDINYTDTFIQEPLVIDGIRLATIDEIVAMKMEIIQSAGRKKDFWDIHEVLDRYPVPRMLELHQQRYPYGHDDDLIIKGLADFSKADIQVDPECLRGKFWELIKLDIVDELAKTRN